MSLQKIFFSIYSGIMYAMSSIFDFILELAQAGVNILPNGVMQTLIDNIYILMSVVMAFYAAIALLGYLVDPNKLSNKNSTGSKLIINVLVTMALLIFTPTIFQIAQDLQTAILNENILGQIILGSDSDVTTDDTDSASDALVLGVTKAILTPIDYDSSDPMYSEDFFTGGVERRVDHISELDEYANNTGEYTFNWLVGWVCGILIILVLFNFCFDVAIRISKLAFLEVIAPFPIVANILPNKKKNILSNWISECANCYLGLFLRIAVLYLAIYIMIKVDLNFPENSNFLIMAMFYVGLMLFVKEAPNLISQIFGFKPSGSFSLNPMDRIRQVPLLGRGVQAVGAGVGGLVTGTALGYRAAGGFKGIAEGFKKDGFKGGMAKIGTVAKSSSLGTLYGGRAGAQQVSWSGISKDKRPKTTGYRAGASSVAQAITGSDKATSGVFDQIYNNIGTQLNKPNYEQKNAIKDAEKAYNQEVENMSVLKDSQREIQSNLRISVARRNNLKLQLDTIDNNINTVTSSRNNRVSTATAPIDSQIAQAESNFRNALATANPDSIKYKQQLDNLKQQKVQIEQQVDTQIQQEIETLRTQKTTVERQYSTANAEVTEYSNQYREVTKEIGRGAITKDVHGNDLPTDPTTGKPMTFEATGQTGKVSDAKKNIKDEKDKLKAMNGPYQKNE